MTIKSRLNIYYEFDINIIFIFVQMQYSGNVMTGRVFCLHTYIYFFLYINLFINYLINMFFRTPARIKDQSHQRIKCTFEIIC